MPFPTLDELRRWQVERRLLPLFLRPDEAIPTTEVADARLPEGPLIEPDWVCYCAGVGEDIRFEVELVRRWGVHAWLFDPTPRSIAFMERARAELDERIAFLPFGLWKEDATLHFAPPEREGYVSHSVMEESERGFDAPCRSIPSLMRELGHDRVDLLKMNIEGAEHVVLESAFHAGVRPVVVTLTWEGHHALAKARAWTRHLAAEGYAFAGRKDWWFTYVRTPSSPGS